MGRIMNFTFNLIYFRTVINDGIQNSEDMERGSERAILEYVVNNGKTSATAKEISEQTGLSLLIVIKGIDSIVQDRNGLNGGTRDGASIILNSRSKLAVTESYYG